MATRDEKGQIIARRIREARRMAGLSQGQVAKMLGLQRPSVTEIEGGNRSVAAVELAALAEVFDVSDNWLLGEGSSKLDASDDRLQLAAHELHKLKPKEVESRAFQPFEFLADAFAGFLLMPAQGVQRAFATRQIVPSAATPAQAYTVASTFGVGYETLINHAAHSLKLMPRAHAQVLSRVPLSQVRRDILGFSSTSPLVVADSHHGLGTVDAEVGSLILLPAGAVVEETRVVLERDVFSGRLFRALRPGLARATLPGCDWGLVVRVSRFQY